MNTQIIALIFLLILAHLAKAVADAQAHGSPRLARWFPSWAGPDSWKRKYRRNDPAQGPRFWLSTTLLVFLSDCWHFANCLMGLSWAGACLLACWVGRPALWWATGGLVAGLLVFEPVYAWLRKA